MSSNLAAHPPQTWDLHLSSGLVSLQPDDHAVPAEERRQPSCSRRRDFSWFERGGGQTGNWVVVASQSQLDVLRVAHHIHNHETVECLQDV